MSVLENRELLQRLDEETRLDVFTVTKKELIEDIKDELDLDPDLGRRPAKESGGHWCPTKVELAILREVLKESEVNI